MLPISAPTPKFFQALLAASASIQDPTKNAKNQHLGNTYATLDVVLEAVREPLRAAGLLLTQRLDSCTVPLTETTTQQFVEPGDNKSRPPREHRIERRSEAASAYRLTTSLILAETGEGTAMEALLHPKSLHPQDVTAACTQLRRQHVKVLLALAETDDDGEGTGPTPPRKVQAARGQVQARTVRPAPDAAPSGGEAPAADPEGKPTAMDFVGWIREAKTGKDLAKLATIDKRHLSPQELAQVRREFQTRKAELETPI